ncbi:polysaccharide deacetylase family protein [Paenibacillus psychroresistens]|uniref:Polysaccharide deacetylase family protein n=1 Tax=Paenibacillus psychroresistens TaxID=1778678 RepID=A0A6B8RLX1_9BACL|nr:polysaccharide deacetylase family protein [Paenibacillus psychroresistens]QGQ96525.1 polysaccharide deacetylase family protein [Paenibacillus psychroresistens]
MLAEVITDQKVIAITFDDGPNPEYTPQFLAAFEEYSSKATFYTIGQQLELYPEIAKLIHEQGHELGNHTYSHPNLTELDQTQQKSELDRTDKLIAQITGEKPRTFRAPFLQSNDELENVIKEFTYLSIGALNVETKDWEQPGVEFILDKTRDYIRNGSILLFHDGFGDRSQSLAAIKILVPELLAQGYQLVTVSELLQLKDL